MSKTATEKKRRTPDFTGVAGELVEATALPAGLHWGNRLRKSPYDALLLDLAQAGEGKFLRFGDARARASVTARAKKLGMKVSYAESGGVLFVRFDGSIGDELKVRRRQSILVALKSGPSTPISLSAKLREQGDSTMDGQIAGAILDQLVRSGDVIKQEGTGTYRLSPTRRQ